MLDGPVGFPTIGVGSRVGVSIESGVERKHGIEDAWIERSGGLHIEIDGSFTLVHDCCLFQDTCVIVRMQVQWVACGGDAYQPLDPS